MFGLRTKIVKKQANVDGWTVDPSPYRRAVSFGTGSRGELLATVQLANDARAALWEKAQQEADRRLAATLDGQVDTAAGAALLEAQQKLAALSREREQADRELAREVQRHQELRQKGAQNLPADALRGAGERLRKIDDQLGAARAEVAAAREALTPTVNTAAAAAAAALEAERETTLAELIALAGPALSRLAVATEALARVRNGAVVDAALLRKLKGELAPV